MQRGGWVEGVGWLSSMGTEGIKVRGRVQALQGQLKKRSAVRGWLGAGGGGRLENKIARDLSRGLQGLERVAAEHSTPPPP